MTPKYSVIIPCRNEELVLNNTLASLFRAIAERKDVEVILLDNGSNDSSIDIARNYDVIIRLAPNINISAVRNIGAEISKGAILVFLDADIEVPECWFQIVDQYMDNSCSKRYTDVLGFVDKAPDEAPWFARLWGLRAGVRRARVMQVDSLPGRNIVLKKEWFAKVDGFNESMITGEDKDFVMRLRKSGARVLSDPSQNVIHNGYERTFIEWCIKEYWRQHSHISLVQSQGISTRLLRFPMLAVLHLLLIIAVLVYVFLNEPLVATSALLLSLIPSLLLSLKYKASRRSFKRLFGFTVLYWARFIVAGVSVVIEFIENFKRKA